MRLVVVAGDGNCLYRAVAQGYHAIHNGTLAPLLWETRYAQELRHHVAEYIRARPTEFAPFEVYEGTTRPDNATVTGRLADAIQGGRWGENQEVSVLQRILGHPIKVYVKRSDGTTFQHAIPVPEHSNFEHAKPICLCMHMNQNKKTMIWYGVHYDALVPDGTRNADQAPPRKTDIIDLVHKAHADSLHSLGIPRESTRQIPTEDLKAIWDGAYTDVASHNRTRANEAKAMLEANLRGLSEASYKAHRNSLLHMGIPNKNIRMRTSLPQIEKLWRTVHKAHQTQNPTNAGKAAQGKALRDRIILQELKRRAERDSLRRMGIAHDDHDSYETLRGLRHAAFQKIEFNSDPIRPLREEHQYAKNHMNALTSVHMRPSHDQQRRLKELAQSIVVS